MWLPVLYTYNQNDVLVDYNEQLLGANLKIYKTQLTSPSSSQTSDLNLSRSSTSNSSSLNSEITNSETSSIYSNCSSTMSNAKSAQNPLNETEGQVNESKAVDRVKKLDNKIDENTATDRQEETSGVERRESKLDNKLDNNKLENKLDNKLENCKSEASKLDKKDTSEKLEKVDKLVDKLAELNRDELNEDVDANNNLCDNKVTTTNCKSELVNSQRDEKSKNEIMSTNFKQPHQCSVATSYHVYSNGCTMSNSTNNTTNNNSNNKRINKNSSNQSHDSSTLNNAQPIYTQHPSHLPATPYTIYTAGHYNLNGQPTILSIPNATIGHLHQTNSNALVNQSSIVNHQTPISQPMNQASLNQPHGHHLHHHNHYHSNQSHNSNHPAHLHYHPAANIQQNYHHSSFNHPASLSQQNNQKNLIKNNSNSIKSSLSSASSSLNSSTTISTSSSVNNNTNCTKSSIINSAYTSTYTTNSNSSPSNSPTASNLTALPTGHQQQTNCQQENKNLTLVSNEYMPPSHCGYYSAAGILNGKDTTYTFRKIFVGGLPYHSTDKTLSKFFQQFGEIEEAVVITDRQSGRSKGYGFVTMCDQESAERAVKDANPIIDGRKANVNLAYLGAKPRTTSIPSNNTAGANLYSLRTNPATGYSQSVISTNSQYSLAPAYMYSNGLLLSQAPAMITGYPTNAPCAYFDYSSFADPTHLTATISPLNGSAYATTQTGPPLNTQANNAQYTSPDANQPTLFAPISTDLTGQVYGFAPIQHRF